MPPAPAVLDCAYTGTWLFALVVKTVFDECLIEKHVMNSLIAIQSTTAKFAICTACWLATSQVGQLQPAEPGGPLSCITLAMSWAANAYLSHVLEFYLAAWHDSAPCGAIWSLWGFGSTHSTVHHSGDCLPGNLPATVAEAQFETPLV